MGFFIYINIFISMGNNTVKRLLKESLNLEYFIKELDSRLDFSSFKMNDDLQPDIWDSEGNMKEEVRTNLIKIADNYWKSLDLGFEYEDITLTGSLANYNWSKYSDVDLHIILDINKLGDNKEMVKDLLDVKTRKWNSDHDITIKGFEVELYLQPHDIKHFATGVYSVMNDEWNVEPKKEVVSLDKETIRKKYKDIVKSVEEIEKDKDNENVINRVDKLKVVLTDLYELKSSPASLELVEKEIYGDSNGADAPAQLGLYGRTAEVVGFYWTFADSRGPSF